MTDSYVTNAAWSNPAGRPDAIDEIADQFERPVERGSEAFWNDHATARWPRSASGLRSAERLHPRTLERRAG